MIHVFSILSSNSNSRAGFLVIGFQKARTTPSYTLWMITGESCFLQIWCVTKRLQILMTMLNVTCQSPETTVVFVATKCKSTVQQEQWEISEGVSVVCILGRCIWNSSPHPFEKSDKKLKLCDDARGQEKRNRLSALAILNILNEICLAF